jgi:hypothetical protein
LAIDIFKNSGITDSGEWYDIAAPEIFYFFRIGNLTSRSIAIVRAYIKTGLSTLSITGSFTNDANDILGTFTTVESDTGSTVDYSEIITAIPAGATKVRLSATSPAFVFIRPIQVSPFAPLTAQVYQASQSITLANSASIALLGGGGSGGGGNSSSRNPGGGGSGYLTHGTVNAGTYTLSIGAGAPVTGADSGSSGGTSTFSTFNAAGGSGGGFAAGGAGGSGGSAGAPSPGADGGWGGNSGGSTGGGGGAGGAGSGVAPNLFIVTSANRGITGSQATSAGGLYGGGAGGSNTGNNGGTAIYSGGSALPGTGGGGGGGKTWNSASVTGGAGGSGALWVLEI